jgi:hypothetical protein
VSPVPFGLFDFGDVRGEQGRLDRLTAGFGAGVPRITMFLTTNWVMQATAGPGKLGYAAANAVSRWPLTD